MRNLESIIELFGEKAQAACDIEDVLRLILEDVRYFNNRGLLTAELLRSCFPAERLAAHQIFLQANEETLMDGGISGNYIVVGGTAVQQERAAHGFFLSGTHATVLDGEADFLGLASGVLRGAAKGRAFQQARVSALDESTLYLRDQSFGVVTDRATGYATDACSVQVSSVGRLFVEGGAFFLARQRAWVSAQGQAFGVATDRTELECGPANRVIPLSADVDITCPEVNLVEQVPADADLSAQILFIAARDLPVAERKQALARLIPSWG